MERLDIKVAKILNLPREKAQKLILNGGVKANGKIILKASTRLPEDSEVNIIKEPEIIKTNLIPCNLPLEIVFEDEYLIVINKQAGVSTHPPSFKGQNTIANSVMGLIEAGLLKDTIRPGIVHRLDKDTTGLLIIAKKEAALSAISGMLARREIKRSYFALCYGSPQMPSLQIRAALKRDEKNRLKMKVVKNGGKEAVTNIILKEKFLKGRISLLEVSLETGRTHQIRVHLSYNKLPIVGDLVYSPAPPSFIETFEKDISSLIISSRRQMLHAFSLKFTHPFTGNLIEITAPLPSDFLELLETLQTYP